MPTIKSVKAGDVVFTVTLYKGVFYVVARLTVEKVEPAYEYLVREIGNQCGALVLDGVDKATYYNTPKKAHKCQQMPFNCCSETAAQGSNGSSIALRPIPKESDTSNDV